MADTRNLQERLAGIRLDSLEEKIRNCKSASEVQELLSVARLARENDFANRDASKFGSPASTAPQSSEPTAKAADDGMFRSVWRKPDGTLQEVEAYSQTGLDTLNKSFASWKGCVRLR